MNKIEKSDFTSLIENIYQTHQYLNTQAVKSVNVALTLRNFLFGFYIVEYEQNGNDKPKYGEKLLINISKALLERGLKNVSPFELSRFRQFYATYPQIFGTLSQRLQISDNVSVDPNSLIANIPYSHVAPFGGGFPPPSFYPARLYASLFLYSISPVGA